MCENLWQHRKGIIKHWLHVIRNGRIYFRSPVVFSINLLSSLKIAIWPLSIILLWNLKWGYKTLYGSDTFQ